MIRFFLESAASLVSLIPRRFWIALSWMISPVLALLPFSAIRRNLNVIQACRLRRGYRPFPLFQTRRKYWHYTLKMLIDFLHDRPESPLVTYDEGRLLPWIEKGGLVIVTLHFGNWEFGPKFLSGFGRTVGSLYYRQLLQGLEEAITRRRRDCGARLFHQRTGMKSALKYLQEGGILTLIVDQDGTRAGKFMGLMDLPVSFPRALEFFRKHGGAPVVPMLLLHDGDRYRVEIQPDLPSSMTDHEVYCTLRDWMEEKILSEPEQWLLLYDRFKLRHKPMLDTLGVLSQCEKVYGQAWQGIPVSEKVEFWTES